MRMSVCKHSKYTMNISVSRYEVQTKYNILTGKKLSADLIQKACGGELQGRHGRKVERSVSLLLASP